MVYFKLLPKILLKPQEAFEELKGNTTGEDGVVTFLIIQVIALLVFGVFSSLFAINIMGIPFGFGTALTLGNALLFFGREFFALILVSYLASWVALKLGGSGNFHETFSFFCYSAVINIIQSVASIGMLFWFQAKISYIVSALNSGEVAGTDFVSEIGVTLPIIIIIFAIWLLWIRTNAISVGHSISKLRSFTAIFLSYAVVTILLFASSYIGQTIGG